MMLRELTNRVRAARSYTMQKKQSGKRGRGALCAAGVLLGSVPIVMLGALSACISVNAPDKPIVIELNINIKQEVIYRLAADAEKTIEANSGVF